jgi:hypothetical protein
MSRAQPLEEAIRNAPNLEGACMGAPNRRTRKLTAVSIMFALSSVGAAGAAYATSTSGDGANSGVDEANEWKSDDCAHGQWKANAWKSWKVDDSKVGGSKFDDDTCKVDDGKDAQHDRKDAKHDRKAKHKAEKRHHKAAHKDAATQVGVKPVSHDVVDGTANGSTGWKAEDPKAGGWDGDGWKAEHRKHDGWDGDGWKAEHRKHDGWDGDGWKGDHRDHDGWDGEVKSEHSGRDSNRGDCD